MSYRGVNAGKFSSLLLSKNTQAACRLFAFGLLCNAWACKTPPRSETEIKPSSEPKNLKIERTEKALFALSPAEWPEGFKSVQSANPDVYEALFRVMRIGRMDSLQAISIFGQQYVFGRQVKELAGEMIKRFDDARMDSIEAALLPAFQRFHALYPTAQIPGLFTFNSSFGYKTIITPAGRIGIGLDLFMGRDYRYYKSPDLQFNEYDIRRFEASYIEPEVLTALFETVEPRENDNKDLLADMIEAGQTLYFLDIVSPDLEDSLKIGYSKMQLKWARENETEIWTHLTENEMIYSTEELKRSRYFIDGPFTVSEGVPRESPPRIGQFIGWMMVKKFAEENPDISLSEILHMKDSRAFLSKSRYRGKS